MNGLIDQHPKPKSPPSNKNARAHKGKKEAWPEEPKEFFGPRLWGGKKRKTLNKTQGRTRGICQTPPNGASGP